MSSKSNLHPIFEEALRPYTGTMIKDYPPQWNGKYPIQPMKLSAAPKKIQSPSCSTSWANWPTEWHQHRIARSAKPGELPSAPFLP